MAAGGLQTDKQLCKEEDNKIKIKIERLTTKEKKGSNKE